MIREYFSTTLRVNIACVFQPRWQSALHYIGLHVELANSVWVEEEPVYFTHLACQVGVPEGLHQPQDLRDVPRYEHEE